MLSAIGKVQWNFRSVIGEQLQWPCKQTRNQFAGQAVCEDELPVNCVMQAECRHNVLVNCETDQITCGWHYIFTKYVNQLGIWPALLLYNQTPMAYPADE